MGRPQSRQLSSAPLWFLLLGGPWQGLTQYSAIHDSTAAYTVSGFAVRQADCDACAVRLLNHEARLMDPTFDTCYLTRSETNTSDVRRQMH